MSVGSDTRSWVEQNVEKVVVVAVLIGLLASAAILVLRIHEGHRILADTDRGVPPERQVQVPRPELGRIERALERLSSPPSAGEPDVRMWVSALRVHCVECLKPIEFDAARCPFCGASQPEEFVRGEDHDSSGDGIPDVWMQRYGLDPLDPYLHLRDLDGDGFTVIEEYRAGTDPTDRTDFPPPVMKLRLEEVRTRPFRLRFISVQELVEGEFHFQINDRTLDRTFFARLGAEVSGYRVERYDEEERTLTVARNDDRYVLRRGQETVDTERTLMLRSLLDNEPIETQVGRTFEMRGVAYEVIDLRRDGIRVREVGAEEPQVYHVGRITEEEREALQRSPVLYGEEGVYFDEEGYGEEGLPSRQRPPGVPPSVPWPGLR